MTVTLQYFDSCPNWKLTDQRIREVVASHRLDVDVEYQLVGSPEAAEQLGFHGSPSILIDGRDPFVAKDTKVGFACRLYFTDSGPADSPTAEQIADALGV